MGKARTKDQKIQRLEKLFRVNVRMDGYQILPDIRKKSATLAQRFGSGVPLST